MDNGVLSAALEYASCGLRVFPVKGKAPLVPSWKEDATTNEKIIKGWFGKADDKVGVAAIIPDWATVLDIDGEQGERSLKEHSLVTPKTLEAKSGRPGGRHLWYLRPADKRMARKVAVLPGIDILVNGYVIMPPSPYSRGGHYAWPSGGFEMKRMVQAPAWMETIAKQEEERKKGINITEFFSGLPEGERQTSLFRYACSLRGRPRMEKLEAMALVREVAKASKWVGNSDEIVERVWRTYDGAKDVEEEKEKEIRIWTLADMATVQFTSGGDLIHGLLPASGYTLLTAPPKKGKSLVAAYAAACLATGTPMWGFKTEQCGVLYLDLEQDEADAFTRWKKILRGVGCTTPPANLHTAFTWPDMNSGGFDRIAEFLVDHAHVRLVVIDTLADIYAEKDGSASVNAYHREQQVMRRFMPISKDYGCAFLVVHHDRKGSDKDLIARASGTYAVTGKAKAVWSFQRDGKKHTAKMEVTGKNVADRDIFLRYDEANLMWVQTNAPSEE